MNLLVASSALSLIIDCSQITTQSNVESWQLKTCQNLNAKYDDVRLTVVRVTSRSVDGLLRRNQASSDELLAGRINIDVAERVDGEFVQKSFLFSVYATKKMWVAKTNLHKGDVLHQSDLELKVVNVAPFVGLRDITQQMFDKKILKNSVQKNGIIFNDSLEPDYVITARQSIDLVISSGNLRIQAQGVAMESAQREGDRIKVKVLDTGAILEGTVKLKETFYVEI